MSTDSVNAAIGKIGIYVYNATQQGVDSVNKSLSSVNKQAKVTTGSVERSLSTLAYRAARTSALLDRYLIDPLKQFGSAAIEASIEVDTALGELQTLLSGSVATTTARVEEYKASLRELSESTTKTLPDLTKGMYEYISAFGELSNTSKGFNIAAKVAVAGLSTTRQAVDLLSSVSLAYGDTSTEVQQHIADLSFETVRLAKTHIPELADNISKVAPIASVMGISLDEVYAAASTLIGITGDTTEVFTQLRRVLISVQKPNQTMVTLLESLGYAGNDAARNLLADKGMVGAIITLNEQAQNMGIAIEKAVGRVQGIMPFLSFQAKETQERFESMYAAMGDSSRTSAMENALDKFLNGIASSTNEFKNMRNAIQNNIAELGSKLLPKMIEIYEIVNDVLKDLVSRTEFPNIDNFIDFLREIGEAIKSIDTEKLNNIVDFLSRLIVYGPSLGLLAASLFTLEVAFTSITTSVTIAKSVLRKFTSQLTTTNGGLVSVLQTIMIDPRIFIVIASAIAAIAAAIFLIVKTKQSLDNWKQAQVSAATEVLESHNKIKQSFKDMDNAYEKSYATTKSYAEKVAITEARRADISVHIAETNALLTTAIKKRALLQQEQDLYEATNRMLAISGGGEIVAPGVFSSDLVDSAVGLEAIDEQIDGIRTNLSKLYAKFALTESALESFVGSARKEFLDSFIIDIKINSSQYNMDEIFSTSAMDKYNYLLGEVTNQFDEVSEEAYGAFNLIGSQIAQSEAELNEYYKTLRGIYTQGDEEAISIANLSIESKKAEIGFLIQQQNIWSLIIDDLSDITRMSPLVADQYYDITKEVFRTQRAMSGIEEINEAIANSTYPQETIDRLILVRQSLEDIVEVQESIERKAAWREALPESIKNIPIAAALALDALEKEYKKGQKKLALALFENMVSPNLGTMTHDELLGYELILGIIKEIKDELDITTVVVEEVVDKLESISTIGLFGTNKQATTSFDSAMETVFSYKQALEGLQTIKSVDASMMSAQSLNILKLAAVELNNIKLAMEALQREADILDSIPDALKKIPGLATRMGSTIGKSMEKADLEEQRSYLLNIVTMMDYIGKESFMNIDYSIWADALKDVNDELGTTADKMDDIAKSIEKTAIGAVGGFAVNLEKEITTTTDADGNVVSTTEGPSKLGTELSGNLGIMSDAISGALDPMTAIISLLISAAMATPEIQEIFTSLMSIFTQLFAVLGPALNNIIMPVLDVFGMIGTLLGQLLLPVLEALAPIFGIIAHLLGVVLQPILMLLSPFLSYIAGVLELMSPWISLVAKAFILLTAPLQYIGTLFSWVADAIKVSVHNLVEWFNHPLRASKRDIWETPDIKEALKNTTQGIADSLAAVNEIMGTGAGEGGSSLTESPDYYTGLSTGSLSDVTSPYTPGSDSASGSAANIKSMTQNNYITVNLGALMGDFDQFVLEIQRRIYELQEVS